MNLNKFFLLTAFLPFISSSYSTFAAQYTIQVQSVSTNKSLVTSGTTKFISDTRNTQFWADYKIWDDGEIEVDGTVAYYPSMGCVPKGGHFTISVWDKDNKVLVPEIVGTYIKPNPGKYAKRFVTCLKMPYSKTKQAHRISSWLSWGW